MLKQYYWIDDQDSYISDNDANYSEVIEIKRLNFFIGKNNAGKSRFLRELFKAQTDFTQFQNFYLNELIDDLIDFINNNQFSRPTIHGQDNQWSSDGTSPVNSRDKFYIESELNLIKSLNFNYNILNEKFSNIERTLSSYKSQNNNHADDLKQVIDKIRNKISLIKMQKWFSDGKLYIPILRGMRPVAELANKEPYIERARKDYFPQSKDFNYLNIITGENLYNELKEYLLGEPEQRNLVKSYEEKLSQYFFDNETVSLIPKHNQDVVNIKIGEDKQRPIYELGDGLQQAIILTYETYMKNNDEDGNKQTYAFFIEEPELHMHAGMVRQLMNFYLNETDHYYFFTTHSNHLLDMADESDQVIIQKFVKQPKENPKDGFDFKIYRCDRDRDLLASLGVKPSSVYLANCTIWVEGITDRLYITKYMDKYLAELETTDAEQYKKYRRFMPNYHYTFVEYAGSNLVHWDFSDEFTDHLNDQGMNALITTSSVLLIADGDIQGKGNRVEQLTESLGKQFYLLPCKETENTLPANIIHYACNIKFSGLEIALSSNLELSKILTNYLSMDGMQTNTKDGFDITQLLSDQNYFHAKDGIGKIIDSKIKIGNPRTSDDKPKKCFADASGTIKDKLKFCRLILTLMDHVEWTLTDSAKELCKTIFEHIDESNNAKL